MKSRTYNQWMREVDCQVAGIAGVSVHDLPDCPFRDWYEDNVTPVEAAAWALEEAGFPEDD